MMTIWVDGIGPRKAYSFGNERMRQRCRFFSLDALAWGLRNYGNRPEVQDLEELRKCLDPNEQDSLYRFHVIHTGCALGSHKPKFWNKATPREQVMPELKELLEALGEPSEEEARARRSAARRRHLEEQLFMIRNGCSRADQSYTGLDLSGFKTLPFWKRLAGLSKMDVSGNFSGSDFTQACIVRNPEPFQDSEVSLSGWFIGARFTLTRFYGVELTGDFAHADFDGAQLHNCRLSGRFHQARMSGLSLEGCEIQADGSFKGADLRGAKGVFCDEKHFSVLKFSRPDKIVVKSGVITLHDRQDVLCKPAQLDSPIRPRAGERLEAGNDGHPLVLAAGPAAGTFQIAPSSFLSPGMGIRRVTGGRNPFSGSSGVGILPLLERAWIEYRQHCSGGASGISGGKF